MKTKILIIFLFSILYSSVISQTFSSADLKLISKKTDSIILAYEKYSGFSEDNENISEYYINKFKNLFDNNNKYIFNDLGNIEIKENKLKLDKYIFSVKRSYPSGLGVQITNVIINKPQYLSSNKYLIKVNLNKRVFGFFRNERIEENTFPLIFTINFTKRGHEFNDFKIVEINNPDEELILIDKAKKWEIGVIGSSYLSSITNNSYNTNRKLGYNANFDLTYYYTNLDKLGYNKIGAGFGLGISTLKSKLFMDLYKNPDYTFIDIDGDTCKLISNLSNIEDALNIHFIDFNFEVIKFKNSKLIKKINIFASISLNVSYVCYSKSDISGVSNDKGYYNKYHVVLYNIEPYGYLENLQFESENNDVEISTLNYSATFTCGISKSLFKSFDANIGFKYRYGSLSISENINAGQLAIRANGELYNEYRSILIINPSSKFSLMGLFAGISYKF
ncbi:MAG: hypothetical protein K8R58_04370 [Bacteroidales bacterium]|nr:hypothetical protein [Bacteroidales bacterium]